jgi:large subunit ribosomal protein L31
MKKNIHPKYQDFVITMTDGTKFTTKSTSHNKELLLDVDFRKHSAWTGGVSEINENSGSISSFNDKYAGLSFLNKKPKVAPAKSEVETE